ncbi:hypothetical protein D3C75_492680 [compost metagenome]
MGVDNAGRRRPQRRDAGQRRFKLPGLRAIQPLQVIDTIGTPLLQQALQSRVLLLVGGHDQLAHAPVIDTVLIAIGVETLLARHAQPRLEAAARVIDAGVNHF